MEELSLMLNLQIKYTKLSCHEKENTYNDKFILIL